MYLCNGEFKQASGKELVSISPVDAKPIFQTRMPSDAEIEETILAAKNAQEAWEDLGFELRCEKLQKVIDLIQADYKDLAKAITMDMGKPIAEAEQEVLGSSRKFDISVESFKKRCAEISFEANNIHAITRHKAHGVMYVIAPYNFPVHVANGHILPALLAGNTVVLKPSEFTAYSSFKFMEYFQKADLPPGVINMLQGDKDISMKISSSSLLDGVLFTGSSEVGNKIQEYNLRFPARMLAMEMGGNNPLIYSDCSNLEQAVEITIKSAFVTNGQRCTCARRLFVLKSKAANEFVEALAKKVSEIKVGDPFDRENFMGPVISAEQATKLSNTFERFIQSGAKSLCEMKNFKDAYLSPGILDMTYVQNDDDNEYFGPLLKLYFVDSLEQAVEMANKTSYGLSSSIITESEEKYQYFFRKIKAGLINWNIPTAGASASMPFGGVKNSGNYRPSAYYAADYCSYPVASMEFNQI